MFFMFFMFVSDQSHITTHPHPSDPPYLKNIDPFLSNIKNIKHIKVVDRQRVPCYVCFMFFMFLGRVKHKG
jgi:hypothetical protein